MFGLDKQARLNRKLIKAINAGETARAKQLLDEGASVEARAGYLSWSMTALARAAWKGNLELVQLLLDRGANVNALDQSGDTPLIDALLRDHYDVAFLLLDHGADAGIIGGENRRAIDLAAGEPKLWYRIRGEPEPPPAPKPEEKPAPPVRADNADEVILLRPFGNRLLEETFNFVARERITLLRNGMDGPVEAMTREGFDTIGDKAALRYAFELYKAKGGKRSESEIFPDALGKVSTLPGRQP